ncbi:MAG: alpha/beta hydrolase [Herpetosiphonaceae bacterium]|nr:MAG: alpha/beta hydrolase [Herpetosiphonaceae bacterium]
MATYNINGQEVHVRTSGQAGSPIALLIHGWSSSWYTWSPLLDPLSSRFFCMAVDLPGYGLSPPPEDLPTIAGYADLMAGLIEQVSDRPVVVLGHSMGGLISMTLALRNPVLVERLVLLNPVVSGRLSTFIRLFIAPHIFLERYRWSGKLLSFLERTPISYQEQLMKPIFFAERAVVSEDVYERLRADARRPGQGRVRAACYRAMQNEPVTGRLSSIEAPALVIWGAEDNTVPLRDAGIVAAEWQAADLRLIPNAGHWPHFEQYETTLRYLAAFLGLPILASLPGEMPAIQEQLDVADIAQFLNNSELGAGLTHTQRLRVAGLCHSHSYGPGELIAGQGSQGDEMFIVREGQIDVVVRMTSDTGAEEERRVTTLKAGQVAGEMALLQGAGGTRTADLRAGQSGATVLALDSRYLAALFEDDPNLGIRILQNLGRSLSQRLRVETWQHQLAEKRYLEKMRELQRQQPAALGS